MFYYPPITRVMPSTTIRRERALPVQGEVLVNPGARVDALSVVARAEVPGHYHILNIAEALRVSPEAADKYIRPRPGQTVKARQVVAGRRVRLGLIPRLVRAPRAGVVIAVGGGRVLLETAGEPIEIRAYLPGTVVNVIPKMGALIETTGALIQGVWGVGGESFGVLRVLTEQHDQPLNAKSIDVSCHGAVLVGGSTMDQEALQQALELQVRGIVIGSLAPTLLEMAQRMPFPIVATEGLGQAPMAQPIFHLLQTNVGREAAVGGYNQPRWGAIRPEIIIPLPAEGAPPPPSRGRPLDVGVRVRVTRGPLRGEVGTVRHLPERPLELETGARVWGAVIAFEKQGEQPVPYLNLELLG